MKVIISTLVLSIFCLQSSAQKKEKNSRLSKFDVVLQGSIESNEGSVILNDGKELVGLVAYNDKTGILRFENGNDSRSLTARSVLGFEVFDPTFDDNRIFYSLQDVDPENGAMRPYFFELLKDFKSFAVLSRKEPLDIKEKRTHSNNYANQNDGYVWATKTLVIQQVETFYFLKPQEDPKPYFSVIVKNNDQEPTFFNRQKVKEKFVDKDLFEVYAGSLFEKVKAHAYENRLSFKEKSDFLKILEYYETLID